MMIFVVFKHKSIANDYLKCTRGRRLITCGDVVRNGLVDPVSEDAFSKACAQDRKLRNEARKRHLTQPKADAPAKRLRCTGTLALAAVQAKRALLDSRDYVSAPGDYVQHALIPENLVDWALIRPCKRVRVKSSLDLIISRGEAIRNDSRV